MLYQLVIFSCMQLVLVHFFSLSLKWKINNVTPWNAYHNLPQPSVMFDPVLVLIELLSTYFNLPQPSVMFDPVLVLIELLSTYFNLPQPSVMFDSVLVLIELLSTYFNLPQPSVMLIQCLCS